MILHRKLKFSLRYFQDGIIKIERCLSNSNQNASTCGVKSCWTSLTYLFRLESPRGMTFFPSNFRRIILPPRKFHHPPSSSLLPFSEDRAKRKTVTAEADPRPNQLIHFKRDSTFPQGTRYQNASLPPPSSLNSNVSSLED